MGLSKTNRELALIYAQTILAPIKYGESGVFFWFPGGGITTIVHDIFEAKEILKAHLKGLAARQKVIQLWGHISQHQTENSVYETAGFSSYDVLEKKCREILDKGNEVVCIVGRFDNYPQTQKLALLKHMVKLNSLDKRRVHILIFSIDKPWFYKELSSHPEFTSLANKLEMLPLLSSHMLKMYISECSRNFEHPVSSKQIEILLDNYGGILTLIKEYFRSNGSEKNLELKLKMIWDCLPEEYRKSLEKKVLTKSKKIHPDLVTLGIDDIKAFVNHWPALSQNTEQTMLMLTTPEERHFWEYLINHGNQKISKETALGILRPSKAEDVSLWAIDQAVSRFRKKLVQAGIDSERLVTLKGYGYIWR